MGPGEGIQRQRLIDLSTNLVDNADQPAYGIQRQRLIDLSTNYVDNSDQAAFGPQAQPRVSKNIYISSI
jgi:hypothetical protein